ncbi:MAG: undecaprenyldiphospho-muramoylpentapeptide beta-N-acetylglucosaminyltransferase [Bacteroidia bacterium]
MQQPERPYRFIISGGGTGGHIFPAISIARALEAAVPGCEILFVGARGRMEMERVPAAGYKIEGLWISGIQRSLNAQNLAFPFKVLASVNKSLGILRRFKPDAVIGVGGYASGPLLYAAQIKRVPSFIQEQNAYAGLTNKLLAGKVKRAYVAYEGMERYFPSERIMLTGNPIRQDLVQLPHKSAEALQAFGLAADKAVVLVLGGSLGARSLNQSTRDGLGALQQAGVQLIWQTGKAFADEAASAVAGKEGFYTAAFIHRMDLAYGAADLIVSRAGAGTISELAVIGKPVVLVPSPYVAEDHQTKNAQALAQKGAAVLVKDHEAGDKLIDTALQLLADGPQQQRLKQALAAFDKRDAARQIADDILKTIGKEARR